VGKKVKRGASDHWQGEKGHQQAIGNIHEKYRNTGRGSHYKTKHADR
jgi:hypothetical protein